ncbi:MAG: penicillin acylase family protein [Gemmatimonadales bacterium]
MNHFLIRFVPGVLILGTALALGTGVASSRLPAAGPLLDPSNGVWGLAAAERLPGSARIRGLSGPVELVVDRRGVPHVFASDELDAYRVLGWVTARDRLFQLELQTRAGAGRLTEWIGEQGLDADRLARRLGFTRMVERVMAEIDTASAGYQALVAYGQGINAWIERMGPAELPIEYRLLRATPTPWRPENTFYLLGRMAITLALNDPSLAKARAAALVGWPAADALFPVDEPIQEPIQPNRVDRARIALAPLPPPGRPSADASAVVATLDAVGQAFGLAERDPADVVVGSNNWAVSGARSASGHALLAGDPHLSLTLPSIWYQAHLVVPNRLDVQGVTLPGAPWIVIGFNRDIAWSFTNTGSDVNDYYREIVDSADAPARYRVDADWRPIERRIERYLGPNGDTIAVDTMRFTHRGPLTRVDSSWMSMAWTAYQAATSGEQFLAANRARSAGEFLEAMGGYVAPAQNMLVADRRGTIAIRSTGRYPVRPGDGRGDVIQDGSRSDRDWRGWLPLEFYPFALNPERGFLSSANQQPVDPAVNRHYLGADWPAPWRALRINQLLRADSAVTVDAMRRYQTDRTSARGEAFLPFLLGDGESAEVRDSAPAEVREARALLAEWGRGYDRDDRRAVLFEAVMVELARRVWDELDVGGGAGSRPTRAVRPDDLALLTLLNDPGSPWWDVLETSDRREGRDAVVHAALEAALSRTRAEHGDPAGDGWRWDRSHRKNIYHLLRLPAFSALDLPVDAGPSTLNPSSGSGTAGGSWRMVVELGPELRAWAIYPGGQSGNPASPHYLDFLPAWLDGRLDSLPIPRAAGDLAPDQVEARIRFTAER